jgi:hypothetical protein
MRPVAVRRVKVRKARDLKRIWVEEKKSYRGEVGLRPRLFLYCGSFELLSLALRMEPWAIASAICSGFRGRFFCDLSRRKAGMLEETKTSKPNAN